jgi:hypothetical protein
VCDAGPAQPVPRRVGKAREFCSVVSGRAGEVAVFEAVGVALRARISAWWTSRSIIAAVTSSPKISPQPENGLLLVTIRLARS